MGGLTTMTRHSPLIFSSFLGRKRLDYFDTLVTSTIQARPSSDDASVFSHSRYFQKLSMSCKRLFSSYHSMSQPIVSRLSLSLIVTLERALRAWSFRIIMYLVVCSATDCETMQTRLQSVEVARYFCFLWSFLSQDCI